MDVASLVELSFSIYVFLVNYSWGSHCDGLNVLCFTYSRSQNTLPVCVVYIVVEQNYN